MTTANSRDVALRIKAQDEATSAINSITDALNRLFGGQQQVAGSSKSTSASLVEMAATLVGVDKAFGTISTAVDRAEASFNAMSSTLARRRTELTQYREQAEEAARAIALLNSPNAVVDAGRQQGPRIAQIKELEQVYDSLQRKIASVSKAIENDEARLNGSRSSLQQLGSTAIAAAQQQETLTKALNDRREVLSELAAEEERIARAQANVAALNARISPTLGGARAADGGATTSALVAREEAAALREAAQAHALFEARVKTGVQAMRESEAATRANDKAIRDLKREIDPLAALQERYAAKMRLINQAHKDGKITTDERTKAERLLANELKRGEEDLKQFGNAGVTLFGLRPYELTNLSYQINDVVTQLASGTSLTQTLAQQGGQILQLFPRAGAAIVKVLTSPAFLTVGAIFAGIAFSIKQAADEAGRLRTIMANLEMNAAGGDYQATALQESVNTMRALGTTAEEAMKSVKSFVDAGLQQDRIDEFGEAAIRLARILGIEVSEAAEQMAEAFSGGYDAIVKLDEATNYLTAKEREHIRTLFEEGKAQEARAFALDRFRTKMDEVAAKQQGEWARSTDAMAGAWENLKAAIGDTGPAERAYQMFEGLARVIDGVAGAMRRLSGTRGLADVKRELDEVATRIAAVQKQAQEADGRTAPIYQEYLVGLMEQQRRLEAERAALQTATGDSVTTDNENSAAAKARADKLHELSIEQELAALRRKGDEGLTQQEKGRREHLAGLIAIRGEEDAQVAAAKRKIAVEKEHADILKEQERLAKSAATASEAAARERERAIQQFNSRVVGAEGGTAQNPNSSAAGFGQFINSTWLEQFRKVFTEQAKGLSEQQILALRNNQSVAKAIIDNYARENARFLEKFGQKVTAANLYLTHFLGAGDALKVLRADGDTPVDQLLSRQVMNANRGYLYNNGRARTADELEAFIGQRIGDTGQQQTAGQAAIAKLLQDQEEAQNRFNRSVEKSNEERQRSIDAMRTLNGLQDSALIAAEREIEIARAEFDLRQRVADLNARLEPGQQPIELKQEQIDKTRELAAAEFDLARARDAAQARTTEAQRPIEVLTAERDALQARIDYLNENGLYDQARSLVPDLTETNTKLREAIDAAIEFYETLDLSNDALNRTPEEIRATIEALKTAKDEAREWITVMGVGGKTIAQTFASSGTNAIDSFSQAIANGARAFGALWASFRTFAADFLRQIAQMIAQMAIFRAVSGLFLSPGSPAGGVGSWAVPGTPIAHTGGVVGHDVLPRRQVAPQWFQNALRYHRGGIAGLAPNEVAAVLEEGEEVLTRNDPRHRFNGGAGGGQMPQDVKVINAFDAPDMLARALETKEGARVILNWVSSNARAFQQAMGG